jgi:hypothetical protein
VLKFASLVQSLFAPKTKKHLACGAPTGCRVRLVLEELEARVVPTLVVDQANPRYFMDDTTGNVVYLAGSSTWNNGQQLNGSNFNYDQYLTYLQSNNNNFFRLWVFETSKTSLPVANYAMVAVSPTIYARSSTPGATDGGNKFDLTQFNQTFFDNMRQRVVEAESRGMYVAVTLFNGFSVQQEGSYQDPWPYHYYNSANNVNAINGDPHHVGNGTEVDTLDVPAITALQEAYARKVVDTLHDLPNVLYEICNEAAGGSKQTQWENHFVNYLHTYEQTTYGVKHPVGFTSEYPNGNNADLFNSSADWIAPNNGAPSPYDYQFNPPPASGNKVIVADTDHLGGHWYLDPKFVWRSFAMGENVLFMDTYNQSYFNDPTSPQMVKNMGYAIGYAGRMNLEADTPQPALSSTKYCLADASATNPEYFVYLPSGGSAAVNLSATTQTLNVEWFDPNTDTTQQAGTVAGGTTRSFASPFGNHDAVLYLSLAAPPSVPAPPTNVTASAGNALVTLTWTASTGATSYNLYRSTSSGGEGATPFLTGLTGTSFTDTGLSNGTTYYYQVTAVNSSGESGQSGEVSATPQLTPPGAPTNLAATAGPAQVSLSWSAVADATSYNLYRATASGAEGGTPYLTGLTTTSFTDPGLTNGTTYYYQVSAVNDGGEGATSAEVSATPQAATGLAAYSFDAGSGSTAADSSGNGNTGTISGATWVTGKHGYGLAFNGSKVLWISVVRPAYRSPAA